MLLKEYLEQSNLSQLDFGLIVNELQPTVAKWVLGRNIPRPGALESIAAATQGKVSYTDFVKAQSEYKTRHSN